MKKENLIQTCNYIYDIAYIIADSNKSIWVMVEFLQNLGCVYCSSKNEIRTPSGEYVSCDSSKYNQNLKLYSVFETLFKENKYRLNPLNVVVAGRIYDFLKQNYKNCNLYTKFKGSFIESDYFGYEPQILEEENKKIENNKNLWLKYV